MSATSCVSLSPHSWRGRHACRGRGATLLALRQCRLPLRFSTPSAVLRGGPPPMFSRPHRSYRTARRLGSRLVAHEDAAGAGHQFDGELSSPAPATCRPNPPPAGPVRVQPSAAGVDDDRHASLAARGPCGIQHLAGCRRSSGQCSEIASDSARSPRSTGCHVVRQVLGIGIEADHAHFHGVAHPAGAKPQPDGAQADQPHRCARSVRAPLVRGLVPVPAVHACHRA